MPKRAKKAWRKNIDLEDLYEGLERTKQELAKGGVVREKEDVDLFAIDEVGAPTTETEESTVVEPPKKRRRQLRVDEVLGTTESKSSVTSHIPKSKRPAVTTVRKNKKTTVDEGKETYDVWTKKDVIPAPKDLPPPAILPYSKSLPAVPPSTLRSSTRLLRPHDAVSAVRVAEGGQSYNPALEDWEEFISQTAEEEQGRLEKIAMKEWVPLPEDVETPAAEQESEDEDAEEGKRETYLGRPVKVQRKTRAQRNKQARQQEQLRLRLLAQSLKSKHKQISNLPSLLSAVSTHRESALKTKKTKELPVAPLEVQLSDELAESLRLLKPEGNLFRDRYRSVVERGIVEGRFKENRRGRKFPVKYVEKYDYKHWGKYYGK